MIDEVESRQDLLLRISHDIHADPEECFGEHHAHDMLVSAIAENGVDVEPSAFGLETAFCARAGSEGPTVAIFCEYDALPGIGHACGHNIIAAAGLGAGLAAASLAEQLGGRVVILGSPAEEGGGGKVAMIEAGALDGVDVAMMIHPADIDLRWMTTIAYQQLKVTYRGAGAHAAAHPWDGRNALDAAVLGYMNVAALRQHIRPDERVHGIFDAAGEKPNIVPSISAMTWYVRASNVERLSELQPRVVAALQGGAVATGCTFEHDWVGPTYADLVANRALERLFATNADRFGRILTEPGEGSAVVGSTDMGNVSHLVPSIHPMLAVSPRGIGIHTPEFASYAASADGDRAVLDGARAMAMTTADLWLRPEVLEEIRSEFDRRRA